MNKDMELDYKDELFSLIDRLSENMKKTCEDMEAKARPEIKNNTYAILYDKCLSFLKVYLDKDEFFKLANFANQKKHISYKKMLFDDMDKNLSEDDMRDLVRMFKALEYAQISNIRNADNKKLLQKYCIKYDVNEFYQYATLLKEKIIESTMNALYKDLYDLYIRSLRSYVDFKINLPIFADLSHYRNNILVRNEEWDNLVEESNAHIFNKVLSIIRDGCNKKYDKRKAIPISISTNDKEQIIIAENIATALKEIYFSYNALTKLSKFYKDMEQLYRAGEKSFKIKSININGYENENKIKLENEDSDITINIIRDELARFVTFWMLPKYKKEIADNLNDVGAKYEKFAIRTITNIFVEHGIFTKRGTNEYNIKDKQGNTYKLPNYIAILIYEICKSLGISNVEEQGSTRFKDTVDYAKKQYIGGMLRFDAGNIGDINIKPLFSDYNKYIILKYGTNKTDGKKQTASPNPV